MTSRRPYIGPSEAQSAALYDRESPYLGENLASRRNGYRPHGLMELLRWYEAECWACLPSALHKNELWHEYVKITDEAGSYARQGGGSVLGTPAYHDAFRTLLEAPRSVDDDGHYRNPIAAALSHIEGRPSTPPSGGAFTPISDGTFMARYLRGIALAGFTYSGVANRMGIVPHVSATYTEAALERLWRAYREEPKARVIRGADAA